MVTILSDNKTDKDYLQSELINTDPVRMYVEQIKMALESTTGTIMGAQDFFDLEELVFEQNMNEQQITDKVRATISNFCSFYDDFETDIDVKFAQGQLRDHAMIDISVNKEHALKVVIN